MGTVTGILAFPVPVPLGILVLVLVLATPLLAIGR